MPTVTLTAVDIGDANGGDDARYHIGVIAQQVIDVFHSHNLDPFEIGLVCYDQWEEEVLEDSQFPEQTIVRPAGNIYSIRPNELFMMEAAWQRRKLEQLEQVILSIDTEANL